MWDCWRVEIKQSSQFSFILLPKSLPGAQKILTLALDNFWEDPSCLQWWQTPAPLGWFYRGMAYNPERRSPTAAPRMTCRGRDRQKSQLCLALRAWTLPVLLTEIRISPDVYKMPFCFVSYWPHGLDVFRAHTMYQSCKWRSPPWRPLVASIWLATLHGHPSCSSWLWGQNKKKDHISINSHDTPLPRLHVMIRHLNIDLLILQTCKCLVPCQSHQF